jgi:hypothetical protein
MSKFTIIQDTKEKRPWCFDLYSSCAGVIKQGMKTGDYTIEGMEDVVCIERKHSSGELYNNCFKWYDRFKREMERMTEFEYAYIVCEFSKETLLEFPRGSGIPNKKIYTKNGPKCMWNLLRYTGLDILNKLELFEERYGVEIIFCPDRLAAQDTAVEILENIYGI